MRERCRLRALWAVVLAGAQLWGTSGCGEGNRAPPSAAGAEPQLEAGDGVPSPLYRATRDGSSARVEELLAEGADVGQGAAGSWTPLHAAAS
jgi:hypothetical protein